MLETTRQKIDKSLEIFLNRAQHRFHMDLVHPILFNSIKEFILREGKRIRPTLLVLSYKGYCPAGRWLSPSIHYVSTCIELLHNFMLIHDDIIDCSNLRRGKPTLHKILAQAAPAKDKNKLGADLGIVAGDIVYALAIDAFLSVKEDLRRKEQALKYFIQTAIYTAMGEFVDTLHGMDKIDTIREKDVFLNYTLKTARYTFDCPLVVGAILAGAPREDVRLLSQFGILMGQAFQIQDDILGIFETEKNIGKSILSDLAECKKTLLVCHAYQHLTGKPKRIFLSRFQKPNKTYADLKAIRKIFLQSGSLNYSLNEIKKRLIRSKRIFDRLQMRSKHLKLIEQSLFQLFHPAEEIARRYNQDFSNIRLSD